MNILRGTFRISLVVAVLAGIWGGVSEWKRYTDDHSERVREAYAKQLDLACGADLPPDEVRQAADQDGKIDLSSIGCSTRSHFWVNVDDLRRDPETLYPLPKPEGGGQGAAIVAAIYAIAAFILINLIGLIAAAFQWAVRGFKAS